MLEDPRTSLTGSPRSAVWPRAPSRQQRKRPTWKYPEIRTQKPALQPEDREMGRLPEGSSKDWETGRLPKVSSLRNRRWAGFPRSAA